LGKGGKVLAIVGQSKKEKRNCSRWLLAVGKKEGLGEGKGRRTVHRKWNETYWSGEIRLLLVGVANNRIPATIKATEGGGG